LPTRLGFLNHSRHGKTKSKLVGRITSDEGVSDINSFSSTHLFVLICISSCLPFSQIQLPPATDEGNRL